MLTDCVCVRGGGRGVMSAQVCVFISMYGICVCVCVSVCVCVCPVQNLVLNNYIFSSTAGTLEPDAIMRAKIL